MADAVLLTGARGCIGRQVLAALVDCGVTVHAVGRQKMPAQTGVIWHQADLLQPADRARVAGLAPQMIHCAWDVSHGTFWHDPANQLWHQASVDLAVRFRAHGGGRIVALGSGAEYCAADPADPWDETRPLRPATAYGQAKCALFRDLSDIAGDDLVWARLFQLYGAGEDQRRLVPSVIAAFASGQVARVQNAGLIRDYASSGHIAACLVALLQSPRAAGAVNIGSGQGQSLGDLAGMIARHFGPDARLALHPPPNSQDPQSMVPDLRALWAATGLSPEPVAPALGRYIAQWTTRKDQA
jgi:nucleoside-diphosphate-sugar epimerase